MPADLVAITTVPSPAIATSSFNAAAAGPATIADVPAINTDYFTIAIVVAAMTGGAAPTTTFTLNGIDAFGNTVVVIAGTAIPAAGGSQLFTCGPGAGAIANQTSPHVCARWRVTWVTTGGPTTVPVQLTWVGRNLN